MTDGTRDGPAPEGVAETLLAAMPAPDMTGEGGAVPPAHEAAPGGWSGGPIDPVHSGIFPPDSPVVALGKHGLVFHFIDADGQYIALKSAEMSKTTLMALYGVHVGWLRAHFPSSTRVGRWDGELAVEAHMAACSRQGNWQPFQRVRGVGGWRGEDGRLLLHCGTKIFRSEPGSPEPAALEPGRIGAQVYPADTATPFPSEAPAGAVGEELLAVLRSFTWQRAPLDPALMLGWIAAAMLGGALAWRPMGWITGDSRSGKSTLQQFVADLFGEAIVSVADVTEASLRQALGFASSPVAVDEFEPEQDDRKAQAIIRLARQAASGAVVLRGGADHNAVSFTARSAFLFSSIYVQSLSAQDQSRMAILELRQRPPDGTGTGFRHDRAQASAWGRRLLRRLLNEWHRFDATLEAYSERLAGQGHSQRAIDQFATLLACADLALKDGPPTPEAMNADEELREVLEQLRVERLDEVSGQDESWEVFLATLLSKQVDVWRSGRRVNIGTLIEWAASGFGDPGHEEREDAERSLGEHGIRVEVAFQGGAANRVCIANRNAGLRRLMENEIWGATSAGKPIWIQAVRRIPGAEPGGNRSIRFAGVKSRFTRFPLSVITDDDED